MTSTGAGQPRLSRPAVKCRPSVATLHRPAHRPARALSPGAGGPVFLPHDGSQHVSDMSPYASDWLVRGRARPPKVTASVSSRGAGSGAGRRSCCTPPISRCSTSTRRRCRRPRRSWRRCPPVPRFWSSPKSRTRRSTRSSSPTPTSRSDGCTDGAKAASESALVGAVRALDLPDTGTFVWVCGEIRMAMAIRTHLRERGFTVATTVEVAGTATRRSRYWRRGSTEMEREERLRELTMAAMQRASAPPACRRSGWTRTIRRSRSPDRTQRRISASFSIAPRASSTDAMCGRLNAIRSAPAPRAEVLGARLLGVAQSEQPRARVEEGPVQPFLSYISSPPLTASTEPVM